MTATGVRANSPRHTMPVAPDPSRSPTTIFSHGMRASSLTSETIFLYDCRRWCASSSTALSRVESSLSCMLWVSIWMSVMAFPLLVEP